MKTCLTDYLDRSLKSDETLGIVFSALRHKYHSVYAHCVNTCHYAYRLSCEVIQDESECQRIALAALLHDIGKLNIDPKILYKPDTLSARETLLMQRHPIVGEVLVHHSKSAPDIMSAILYHHERYDGTGYCEGLEGDEIPIEGRIVAISDAFDAMISYRSHKEAITVSQAVDELQKNSGTQFDPGLVDCFLSLVAEGKLISVSERFSESRALVAPQPVALDISGKENQQSHIDWHRVLDRLPHTGVMVVDRDNIVQYTNIYFRKIRSMALDCVGGSFWDLHKPHRVDIIKKKLKRLKSGEIDGWSRLMAIKGKHIENKYSRIVDAKGEYDGFLLTTEDVSTHEALLRDLQRNVERSNILVKANTVLANIGTLENALLSVRDLIRQVMAHDHVEMVINEYAGHHEYVVDGTRGFTPAIHHFLDRHIQSILINLPNEIVVEQMGEKKRLVILPLPLQKENSGVILIQIRDEVTLDRGVMELLSVIGSHAATAVQNHLLFTEINEMAIRDNLTGIYNRQYFQRELENLDAGKHDFGFIVLDIDGLKAINDTLSHMIGDQLIKRAAEIIKKSIRSTDLAFRYGGDEFVILVYNARPEDVMNIMERINGNIEKFGKIDVGVYLKMSQGFAISYSSDGIGVNETLLQADKNMYAHKQSRKKLARC